VAIAYGYQTGWYLGAAALLLIGLPFSFWAYSIPREPHGHIASDSKSDARNWTRSEVIRDPVFWALLTGVLAPGFIGTTIFYHQNYLTELNGWPPQLFVQSLITLSTMTVIFTLISGAVINKFGARVMLPYFLVPLAVACFLLAASGPALSVYVVMVFLGISYGISWTLFGALWPEIYGTAHLGSIRAITVSAIVFATAAGPGLTGTLIDFGITLPRQMNYFGSYCLMAIVVMTIATVFLKRRINPGDSDELFQD
jgi:MFS family permease